MSSQLASQYLDQEPCSLPWLGSFPTHWKLAPGFAVLRERQVKNVGMAEKTVLSLSYGRVIVKPEEKLRGLVPESFETYQIVEPGNIIIRPTDLQNDQVSLRVGQVKDRGIITSAYLCLEAYGDLSADYAHLLLLAYDLKKVFYGLGSGLRQNLSWNDFRRLPIPLPSRLEQEQIVRFVRQLDSRVNRLIKAKRRLIELLNEQKQAIIHQAVTRGLDPTVPLKPSGLVWIPQVPSHWDVVPNGSLMKPKKRLVGERHTEYTLLSLTKQGVIVRDLSENKGKFSKDLGTSQEVKEGDLVFCLFDIPETPRTVGLSSHDGMITSAYTVMTPRDSEVARYVAALYIAMDNGKLLSPMYSGLRNTIAPSRFLSMRMPLPPKEERAQIVNVVEAESASIEATLAKVMAEIELIREYRTRLVADVVTGQLDVRHLKLLTLDEIDVETPEAEEVDDLDLDSLPEDGVLT